MTFLLSAFCIFAYYFENSCISEDICVSTNSCFTVKSIGKASPNQPSFKNKKGGNKVLYCDKFKRNLTSRPIAGNNYLSKMCF